MNLQLLHSDDFSIFCGTLKAHVTTKILLQPNLLIRLSGTHEFIIVIQWTPIGQDVQRLGRALQVYV